MTSLFSSSRAITCSIMTLAGLTGASVAQENLLENGSFESGLTGWTSTGQVSLQADAWEGTQSVRLQPASQQTAQLIQQVNGLEPGGRYTIAARIRTSNPLHPPIVGIRDGAQIAKAHGWVAVDDADIWLERRFEVHVDDDGSADGASPLRVLPLVVIEFAS